MTKRKTLEDTLGTTTTTGTSSKLTITGTIFYAHVREPNNKPNKSGFEPSNKFELDLSVGPKTKAALEDEGILVENKGDEKGDFVRLRSTIQPFLKNETGEDITLTDGTTFKNGTQLQPTRETEEGLTQGDTYPLIGNGSVATITGSLYDNRPSNYNATPPRGGKRLMGLGTISLKTLVPFGETKVITE